VFEPDAGFAFARRACRVVAETFKRDGGTLIHAAVEPVRSGSRALPSVMTSDGEQLDADGFVFACGPWLPQVLPDVLTDLIRPTRQELFYFGELASGRSFDDRSMPAWVDHGDELWYGSPGNDGRGFKVGDDTRGIAVDPTTQDRVPTAAMIEKTRGYAARRFPALADSPIVESRVCQYENSPDNDFIIDRHPAYSNVWFAGGGSGHGFKHAPAIGELVAGMVLDGKAVPGEFALGRFSDSPADNPHN